MFKHFAWLKIVGGFKDKFVSLFNTNTPEPTVYGRGKKLSKPKTKETTIKNNKNIFTLKK